MIRITVSLLCVLVWADQVSACSRCGLFGNRCKLQHAAIAVAPVAVVRQPEVFVVQNNYAGPNGQASLLAQQGGSVYGFQGAAAAYTLDPSAVLRQAADLARGAQSLAQTGLDGYNQSAGLALSLNAQVQEPLARGTAAALVLNAAGLNQPAQSTQQAIRLSRDASGRWQVEHLEQPLSPKPAAVQSPEIPAPVDGAGATVAAKCAQCHGTQLTEPKGGMYFDRGTAIDCRTAMKAIQSVMSGKMPKGQQLTAEERTALVNELLVLGKETE